MKLVHGHNCARLSGHTGHMPATNRLRHGGHDRMDIRHICRLFSHCCHPLICWSGVVGLIVGLGLLRLPLRLSSRVRVVRSQHTPVILVRHDRRISLYIEDTVTEFGKHAPLEWFGKEVTEHLSSRTVSQRDLTTISTIRHEVVANVDMTSSLTTGRSPVLFQEDSTLIVLVDNAVLDIVPLCG